MTVNAECDARICVAKLRLCYGWRGPGFEKQAGVSVTEGMKAAAWNVQRIENGNKMVSHYVLSDE